LTACRPASLVALIVVLALPAVVAAAAAAATTTPSVATRGRVQVLQPSAASPRARRCLTRLREELTSGGFEIVISEFGAGGDALWMVGPPSPRDGLLATITLIGNPDEGPAELWIVDGAAGVRFAVRRLLLPGGSTTHDDEVLAVRTLEFLRASALELARAAASGGATTPPPGPANTPPAAPAAVVAADDRTASTTTTAAAPPVRPASPGPISLELGVGLLEASRSLGPAYLPLGRLRAELEPWLEARLTVAGLGTSSQVVKPAGTTTVDCTIGLVELRTAFRHGRAVRPAVGLGGGVLLARIDGVGTLPYEGRSGRVWAGLLDVGAGVTIALGQRFAVAVEAHGQIAGPYPTVEISGQEVARIARPALLASLTLVTAL